MGLVYLPTRMVDFYGEANQPAESRILNRRCDQNKRKILSQKSAEQKRFFCIDISSFQVPDACHLSFLFGDDWCLASMFTAYEMDVND